MKKHVSVAVLISLLILFVAIPVFTQLTKPEPRAFHGAHLGGMTYQEVIFENSVQDLELAGMLFVPEGEGPFPAAVIIQGSGTSHRDSSWDLTLTRYLQENGIVVLLPDKRGSGRSEGDWRTSSFEDLPTDALAALSYLKDQEEVELSHIGVVGMSQGGRIAPIVATESSDVTFVVNVVGNAILAYESLRYEEIHNLRELGLVPGLSDIVAYLTAFIVIEGSQPEFWDAIGNFDPIQYWEKVNVSSLILFGEHDTNTPSIASAARLRSLEKPNIEVIIYEGSGHALEDPVGQGDSIFREDAMRQIRDLIYSVSASF